MKKLLLLLFSCISASSFSQKFTLEGAVKNSEDITLEGATVFIQSIKDSVVMAYGITNNAGKFSIRVNAEDQSRVLFNIAYLGYKSYNKDILVPDRYEFNMGTMTLENQIEELELVSIISRAPPVLIKKDTIEYNADSFKTLPNDKAEDLLKKLPGIEIDVDGNITVNGIEVEAVNVDGMRFFGEKNGDIALKNLPSNVISKVQVTDYKTNQQKFTGEESDSGTKEINLKIKKGKNTAFFGDLNGGIGTDDKYQANANLFKLTDGKQIGVIGGANNINMSRGFNALPNADKSNGYIESDFLGANFTKGKWNETRVNGNYRYSSQNRDTEQKRYRENFLPDLNYISETNSNGRNDSDRHVGGLDLKFIIPSKNKLSNNRVQLSNETDFRSSNSNSYSNSNTISSEIDGDLINDYTSTKKSISSNSEFKNSFSVTPRIGKGIEFFNITLNTNFNKSNADSENYSENILYDKNRTTIQDQISNSENETTSIRINAIWIKELFPNFRMIPKYNTIINNNKSEKNVYDFNEAEGEYNGFNDLLSTDNKYITTTIRPALRLRYEYKDFRFEIEGGYTNTFRKFDDDLIEARDFKADFEYFTYSGRIRYRDKNGYKNINLNYNQNVDLPSVSQLQPFEDVSNITHIRAGNPFLKPEINHSINFKYQNNIAFHNINVTGNARAQFVEDKIINTTITDEDLLRYTTYDNINGDYSLSGNVAISKSYFSQSTNFNINLRFSSAYRNTISIQNAVTFVSKNARYRPSISLKYSYDNKIDLSTTYSYSINETVYDSNAFENNGYFVQNLRFDASIFFLRNAFLSNKVSYRYNSRVGDDFDGDALFWNAGLGLQLWDNKATITLVGYDLLGKNNGFSRTVSETYIQDVENRILEQYFMLTFVYKFGRFAGQNMNIIGDRGSRGNRGYGGGRSSGGGRGRE